MSETLEQHLEGGWKLLESGDLAGARKAAEAARVLDENAPEPYVLLGAAASAGGETADAKTAFARAMKLDPEYFEPIFLAAEVAAAEGELEDALALADRALDVAEEEEEWLDTLLLKAELELGLEDPDAAAETLAELPPVDLPDASFHVRAGGCLLELDDLDAAERHFTAAVRLDPDAADGYHGLGLTAEAQGEEKQMITHFQKVRELDLKAPQSPWTFTMEQLEKCVDAALGELPERARTLLGNVPVLVEEYPGKELIDDGLDPRLLGLFTGTPYPEQSNVSGLPPHLEHVLLFKRNLERDARTADEIAEEIRITLLHETGHFFGMDEEDLEEAGLE